MMPRIPYSCWHKYRGWQSNWLKKLLTVLNDALFVLWKWEFSINYFIISERNQKSSCWYSEIIQCISNYKTSFHFSRTLATAKWCDGEKFNWKLLLKSTKLSKARSFSKHSIVKSNNSQTFNQKWRIQGTFSSSHLDYTLVSYTCWQSTAHNYDYKAEKVT